MYRKSLIGSAIVAVAAAEISKHTNTGSQVYYYKSSNTCEAAMKKRCTVIQMHGDEVQILRPKGSTIPYYVEKEGRVSRFDLYEGGFLGPQMDHVVEEGNNSDSLWPDCVIL